jgi:hypothetical protein
MIQNIQNCYMYYLVTLGCMQKEDLNDYEEKLLQKCFDNNYDRIDLGKTDVYIPPFISNNII